MSVGDPPEHCACCIRHSTAFQPFYSGTNLEPEKKPSLHELAAMAMFFYQGKFDSMGINSDKYTAVAEESYDQADAMIAEGERRERGEARL